MRYLAAALALSLVACADPLGTLSGTRWTMDVAASPCWSAFTVGFTVDANGIGQWQGGGRVVADGAQPTEARFFPASGGRGADYVHGTFTDPHGVMTGGGSCEASATLAQ